MSPIAFGLGSSRAFGIGKGTLTAILRPNWISAYQAQSTLNAPGFCIDKDSLGNVYFCGIYEASGNPRQLHISKMDDSGNISWRKLLATTTSFEARDIFVDASSNLYVLAYNNTVSILVKYNSSGVLQWQYNFSINGSSVTVDTLNNIYICGKDTGGSNNDAIVIKLDSSANTLWERSYSITSTSSSVANDIKVGSSGDIYMVSASNGITSSSIYDASVMKINGATGVIAWQKALTNSSFSSKSFTGIDIDSSENIYVCGFSLYTNNRLVSIIAKYNSIGVFQWQRSQTPPGQYQSINTKKITLDSSSNFYLTGTSSNGGYIAKYDSSGTLLFERSFTEVLGAEFTDISSAQNGNFYVSGSSYQIDSEKYDSVILKLPNDGSKTGTYDAYTYSTLSGFSSVPNLLTEITSNYISTTTSIVSRTASNQPELEVSSGAAGNLPQYIISI
jgi:hypothetical protein